MALKKCKECKNDVSSKAKVCPSCGAHVPKGGGLGALVIIVVLVMLWMNATPNFESDSTTASSNSGAATSPKKTTVKTGETTKVGYTAYW